MNDPAEIVTLGPDKVRLTLQVNGKKHEALVEPRRTLLDTLRQELALKGAKKGCDEGTCGSCTVLLNGRAVYSCLTLAVDCEGCNIETIEGLSENGELHPIQQAFIDQDGYQCGFCTPGQIMAVKALLDATPNPTPDAVRRAVSGNLCRCGAYPKIVQAAMAAANKKASGTE